MGVAFMTVWSSPVTQRLAEKSQRLVDYLTVLLP